MTYIKPGLFCISLHSDLFLRMSFGKYSVSGIQNDFLNTVLNKKSQLKISHAYVLQELLEHLIITDVFAISTDLGWFKCLKNGFYISNNYWPVTIYSTKQVLFYPYNFLMWSLWSLAEFYHYAHCTNSSPQKCSIDKSNTRHA